MSVSSGKFSIRFAEATHSSLASANAAATSAWKHGAQAVVHVLVRQVRRGSVPMRSISDVAQGRAHELQRIRRLQLLHQLQALLGLAVAARAEAPPAIAHKRCMPSAPPQAGSEL